MESLITCYNHSNEILPFFFGRPWAWLILYDVYLALDVFCTGFDIVNNFFMGFYKNKKKIFVFFFLSKTKF